MSPRQPFEASRIFQPSPFRPQRCDGVLLAPDFAAHLGHARDANRRLELDFVHIGGGEHEHDYEAEIEQAHPRYLACMIWATDGNRGSVGAARWLGGVSARSAARSFADRARGLAAISLSSDAIGRLVSKRNVGVCTR